MSYDKLELLKTLYSRILRRRSSSCGLRCWWSWRKELKTREFCIWTPLKRTGSTGEELIFWCSTLLIGGLTPTSGARTIISIEITCITCQSKWLFVMQVGLFHGRTSCVLKHEPNGCLREGPSHVGQMGRSQPRPPKNPSLLPEHVA